jgi:hypothetical protein
MDCIAWGDIEAEEFFFDFLTQEIEAANVPMLCSLIGCEGTYTVAYPPQSLQNLVILHGAMYKNYSSDEIAYMQCSCNSVFFCSCNEKSLAVIYVEIDILDYNRDLIAWAILKIIFKSFGMDVMLCFKHGYNIAFGITISAENTRYALSRWYSVQDIQQLAEFCINCNGDPEEIEYEIRRSFQESREGNVWDTALFNYGYLDALHDIATAYDVNLSAEIERYLDIHSRFATSCRSDASLKDILNALRFIGIDEISSDDYLEKAADMSQTNGNNVINIGEAELYANIEEDMKLIPKEAFDNAETMLKYLSKEDGKSVG